MRNFVFITDTHFCTKSNVRTGDYLDDLTKKLDWVVNYCNANNAALLHAGDWFDTPSVPDIVKASVIRCLVKCKYGVYAINGNHDTLYSNRDFMLKTSFNILVESGIVHDLDCGDIEFDDCVLTSAKPIKADQRPVIALSHGILNGDEEQWSFKFTDIEPNANDLLVLLGHDHLQYDDLQFGTHTTIIRPGSFARDERTKEHMRIPQLVHITVDNNKLSYKYVDIAAARPCTDIFKTREAAVSETEKAASYAEVISQLASARTNQMTFQEALASVSEPDVYEYCIKLLEDFKRDAETKCKNL